MSISNPYTLIAELSYRCPLQCPYCSNPVSIGDAHYRDELSTEDWCRVFREARALGVIQLGLTGGEPLVRRDLEQLVAAAREAGLYSTLVTSAVPLARARLEALQAAGLDHVQISIQDYQADSSDRIAGYRSFDRKLEAAGWVKELGMPLSINVVLHRQNLDHLDEILELCHSLGAARVELANTQYYGWAALNTAVLMPTRAQVANAEAVYERFRARPHVAMDMIFVIPDYHEDLPKTCMGGWGSRSVLIAPNGDVLPCHAATVIPELHFDNVKERSLSEIWFESDAFNAFRGTEWMQEPCVSCPLGRQEVDLGGCRCQAMMLTGDPRAADPVCRFSSHHHRVTEVVAAAEAAASDAPAPDLVYRVLRREPARP
jgi:pyrroloquinoline quinone biosynthesis protein E